MSWRMTRAGGSITNHGQVLYYKIGLDEQNTCEWVQERPQSLISTVGLHFTS